MANTADSTANRRSPFEDGNYHGAPKLPTFPQKSHAVHIGAGLATGAGAPIVLDEDDYKMPIADTHHNNNATASGTGGSQEKANQIGEVQDHKQVDVDFLQRRLAAAEAESARHVQIISSMHEWAYKTTTSLRQVQEKCENAENRAKVAETEVNSLKHQLTQVAAQVEAMVVAAGSPLHVPAAHGGGSGSPNGAQSKRRRKKELPRVNTLTSLAADDDKNIDNGRNNLKSRSTPEKTSNDKNNNNNA
jgi:hypothetical protein